MKSSPSPPQPLSPAKARRVTSEGGIKSEE